MTLRTKALLMMHPAIKDKFAKDKGKRSSIDCQQSLTVQDSKARIKLEISLIRSIRHKFSQPNQLLEIIPYRMSKNYQFLN